MATENGRKRRSIPTCGLFSVGPDGVEGGMKVFQLADTEDHAEGFNVGACSLPETHEQWQFVKGCEGDQNVVCMAPPSVGVS